LVQTETLQLRRDARHLAGLGVDGSRPRLGRVVAIIPMEALGGTANDVNWIVMTMVAIVLTLVCVVVSYRKTDGEWRWRWGSGDR
jgi:hypothetical protein